MSPEPPPRAPGHDLRNRYPKFEEKSDCPATLYIQSLGSEQSKSTMKTVLNRLANEAGWPSANDAPWAHLDYVQANALIQAVRKPNLSAATYKLYTSALKGVARQAYASGKMEVDVYQRLLLIKPPSGVKGGASGRPLTPEHLNSVLVACEHDHSVKGRRDLLVLGLIYAAGLRRMEVGVIEFVHNTPHKREARSYVDFGASLLRVVGKGSRARNVTISAKLMDYIEAYIDVRGEAQGPLLQSVRKRCDGYYLTGHPITGKAVYNIVKNRGGVLPGENYSPHDFRRTFGSELNAEGSDIVTIKELLGHTSITTTQRYIYVDEVSKANETDKLGFGKS